MKDLHNFRRIAKSKKEGREQSGKMKGREKKKLTTEFKQLGHWGVVLLAHWSRRAKAHMMRPHLGSIQRE